MIQTKKSLLSNTIVLLLLSLRALQLHSFHEVKYIFISSHAEEFARAMNSLVGGERGVRGRGENQEERKKHNACLILNIHVTSM